jgi:sulfoxide reductase heme-binding subunit YedZ
MQSNNRTSGFLKKLLFLLSFLPLLLLIGQAFTAGLGANPVEKTLHHTGDWALNFLLITLAVSPLHRLTGFTWPVRLRRMTGLFCFFYASLHAITYVALDQFFDWDAILSDIVKHKRIIIGLASYILLIPLVVTSTNRMVKRLGAGLWNYLHSLVYLAAAGGAVHYLWLVKLDIRRPLIYSCILIVLLGVRLLKPVRRP